MYPKKCEPIIIHNSPIKISHDKSVIYIAVNLWNEQLSTTRNIPNLLKHT